MKKSKINRICYIIAVIVCAITFFTSAQSSSPDIATRVLVSVIGIDKSEEGVRASAQIMVPVSQQEGASTQEIVSSEGATLAQALDKMNISLGRIVEFANCGMIVIGHDLAEDGILEHIGFLLSSGKVPVSCSIVTSEADAQEFLEHANKVSDVSGLGVNTFISYSYRGAHIPTQTLLRFMSKINGKAQCSYLPRIELGEKETAAKKKKESGSEQKKDAGAEESGAPASKEPKYEIKRINQVEIFYKGKAQFLMTEEATRGLAWVEDFSNKGLIEVSDIKSGGQEIGSLVGQLKYDDAVSKVSFEQGRPHVRYDVTVKIELEDRHVISKLWRDNLFTTDQLKVIISNAFNDHIKGQISATFEEMKANNLDMLNITNKFNKFKHKELKAYLEQHDGIIQQLTYDIVVKAIVL